MDSRRNVVLAVRGAESGAPGSVVATLASALPGAAGSYHRADLACGGVLHPRLVSTVPGMPELVEVTSRGPSLAGRPWQACLERLLGLVWGLPGVCFDWCGADPARCVRDAYRGVAETALLWTLFPVLLTMAHTVATPAALPNRVLLDAAVLAGLGLLAGAQRRLAGRVSGAGCAWVVLCLVLCGALWRWPQWTPRAGTLAIRVYGLGQLLGALVLAAAAVEIGVRSARREVPWRQGLAAFVLAAAPFGLASLLAAVVWAGVLDAVLALGSAPVLDALKAWQQTFVAGLGYPLAVAEWGNALTATLVAVVAAAGAARVRRAPGGATARRWLLAGCAVAALGGLLVSLCMLLASPYLRAPLAARLQWVGRNADAATVFTWSALRVAPWVLLWLTPLRGLFSELAETALYLAHPDGPGPSTRRSAGERLREVLNALDCSAPHDGVHVVAQGHAAVVAAGVLRTGARRQVPVVTTLGSPAGTLFRDVLGWPDAAPPPGIQWRNFYREGDPFGGPVGDSAVDVPLNETGHADLWSRPEVAERILRAS